MSRKLFLVVFSMVILGTGIGVHAQVGWLFGGEVRAGAAWLSPKSGTDGVELSGGGGFTFDYTQHFGRFFALNLNYLYGDMDVTSAQRLYYPNFDVKENLHLQSYTVAFQLHFVPDGKVDPYVGAGVNFLYTPSSGGKIVYLPGGFATPNGGNWSNGYTGAAFQAGLTWKPFGLLVLNADAKYIDNGVELDYFRAYTQGGMVYYYPAGTYKLKVNPTVVSVSVGIRW